MGFFTERLSFDFGSSNIRIVKNRELVLEEPCQIELDDNGKVIATGSDVLGLNGNRIIYPIQNGCIVDLNAFQQFLRSSIKKLPDMKKIGFLAPSLKAFAIIPDGITEVEMRAVRDTLELVGSRDVYMMFSSFAICEGLKQKLDESFILIDAGAGKVGISLIHSGEIVGARKLNFGSIKLKDFLRIKIQEEYQVLIDENAIGNILNNYLTVSGSPRIEKAACSGSDSSGKSVSVDLDITKLNQHFEPYFKLIENEILILLDESGLNDFKKIIFTGGLSKVNGFENRLSRKIKLPVVDKSDTNYLLKGLLELDSKFDKIPIALR